MAQLNAGINPYPGTRGYIPPTAKGRGVPPPQGPLPIPIPGPMPPGNKIPPFMPPPRLPEPRLPQPVVPSRPPKQQLPPPSMQLPKQLPPSVGAPRPPISIPVAPKDNFLRGSKASTNLPLSMPDNKLPSHVKEFNLGPKKPTLDSFIPRYIRNSRKV